MQKEPKKLKGSHPETKEVPGIASRLAADTGDTADDSIDADIDDVDGELDNQEPGSLLLYSQFLDYSPPRTYLSKYCTKNL